MSINNNITNSLLKEKVENKALKIVKASKPIYVKVEKE
ncbi:MAG: hypothetical protein PWQ59_1649 [Thermoanaerobacterium sp.]|jgi:hypothetical protein|nr:hypothetical protein [Thermoanaerobacterium sp.]